MRARQMILSLLLAFPVVAPPTHHMALATSTDRSAYARTALSRSSWAVFRLGDESISALRRDCCADAFPVGVQGEVCVALAFHLLLNGRLE